MSTPLAKTRAGVLPLLAAVLLASCGVDIVLPPATVPVQEDDFTLHALTGTPVDSPSAYSMLILLEIRTDETTEFDFAFEIGVDSVLGTGTTGDTVAVLFPRGALGFTADGGLQLATQPYDSILRGPLTGYQREQPTVIAEGEVVLAASRLQTCNFNVVRPRVAKLRIDDIDFVMRTVTFHMVINPNCGYLSLVPGEIPKN
jgi:hypothetical protein